MPVTIDNKFLVDFLIDQAIHEVRVGDIEIGDIDWFYVESGLARSSTLQEFAADLSDDDMGEIAGDVQQAVACWLDDEREMGYRMNWELSLRSIS